MSVDEGLLCLGHGRRRAGLRLVRAALDGSEESRARAVLDAETPEPPWGVVRIERLRFGPPESWLAWRPGRGLTLLKLWTEGMGMPNDLDRRLALGHPGVAALLAWGEGWALSAWVEGRPLGRRAPEASTLAEIRAAVDALHAAGLAHGDLSPANIILGPNGAVLVDWLETNAGTEGWGLGIDDAMERDRYALERLRMKART